MFGIFKFRTEYRYIGNFRISDNIKTIAVINYCHQFIHIMRIFIGSHLNFSRTS
ncbi:Uncharacterised protein [Klebsiella quasipneumoniae]|nr:Uncharacterised protein [Klebsiella quasipneumoniae]SBZ06082.1 Uncharacterised protein [Klebsiella quasipneumoniae]